MNWTNSPAAENQPGYGGRPVQETHPSSWSAAVHQPSPSGSPAPDQPPEIRIGKCLAFGAVGGNAKELEVFTLTMGGETIELLPLKNWGQLDHYKWTVRGKLPAEPAGLEIAVDHVRIMGGTVVITDPAGCVKLEQLFNAWLQFERETVELARKKARPQPQPTALEASAQPAPQPLRFRVEVDKRGQVHIHCLQGKNTLASVGLSIAGFTSLQQQGLMRKPHALATGALHDWVELDGELCSFETGRNDAARLEQILNERYIPEAAVGRGKEVVVFLNPASSTGFDIQFPVMVGGMPDNHRHHLNDHSLELLQDADHCGLLHKGIIIKLIPPNLVFKQKTPDGGEQYLAWGPEYTVTVTDEEGQQTTIPLHQPLNLLRLSAAELTAVFNHPAVNRHAEAAPPPGPAVEAPPKPTAPGPASQALLQPAPPPRKQAPLPEVRKVGSGLPEPGLKPVAPTRPLPNSWLKEVLAQPALPPEWFAVLAYSKLAERLGNSSEGKFGPCDCWFISLGESEDIADPAFKGMFITEKGSLGFLNEGYMARFYNRIAFIGLQDSALEGVQVALVAVGLDERERVVFILGDNYRSQFGVQEATVGEMLNRLREHGAIIMSVAETLVSTNPLEVVWTVPAEQADPSSPEARENTRQPA
jgi:hypothetical protein